jgi:hypothetical protein
MIESMTSSLCMPDNGGLAHPIQEEVVPCRAFKISYVLEAFFGLHSGIGLWPYPSHVWRAYSGAPR